MKALFLLLTLISAQLSFGQGSYFEKGNALLQKGKNKRAQKKFEKGLLQEPQNLRFKNQLALSLINQGKNEEAEKIIQEVLKTDSLNIAALWYGGINSFKAKNGDFRKTIDYFERTNNLMDKSSGQYLSLNYLLGTSYRNLLYSEGISFTETERMLEAYKIYTGLQLHSEEDNEITNFIKYVEANRPANKVKKWLLTNSKENAIELKEKQLEGIDLIVPFDSIAEKSNIHEQEQAQEPAFFVDYVKLTRTEIQQIQPDEIAKLIIYKDTEAIKLIGEQGKYGAVFVETKKFTRNKYWNYFKTKSSEYLRIVPTPESDSFVVYILNGKVQTIDFEGALAKIDDTNFIELSVIDQQTLNKQYGIKDKEYGIIVKTKNEN